MKPEAERDALCGPEIGSVGSIAKRQLAQHHRWTLRVSLRVSACVSLCHPRRSSNLPYANSSSTTKAKASRVVPETICQDRAICSVSHLAIHASERASEQASGVVRRGTASHTWPVAISTIDMVRLRPGTRMMTPDSVVVKTLTGSTQSQ